MDETVTSLYSKEETARAKQREKRLRSLCAHIAGAAVIACVVLCVLINTGHEHLYRHLVTGISALGGCLCICIYMLGIRPAKAFSAHAEGLEKAEKEEYEGILLPGKEYFSIPKSVTVCRIRLQGEKDAVYQLSVRADREKLLPAAGTRIRAVTARKYILSVTCPESNGSAPREADGGPAESEKETKRREQREKRAKRIRKFRKLLSPLPAMLLCVLMSVLVWGWILNLRTDTSADKKITLYTTASITDQTALSVQIEEWAKADGAENIRMAQAREFTYFMFGGDALEGGDLFIIRESEFDDYGDWFTSLPEQFRDLPDRKYLTNGHGTPFGIRIYTPGSENEVSPYLSFTEEDWYLFFGKESLHLAGNRDAADSCAADTARHLLNME